MLIIEHFELQPGTALNFWSFILFFQTVT